MITLLVYRFLESLSRRFAEKIQAKQKTAGIIGWGTDEKMSLAGKQQT